jgi:RNA polymerase sporulation-specific sigma factor
LKAVISLDYSTGANFMIENREVFMRAMVIAAREDEKIKLELLKRFEPLIKKCIKFYIKDFNYYGDAMQEGYCTILKCIKSYDIASKCEFPAYVKSAMIHNMRDFSKKIINCLSLDEPGNETGGTLMETLRSDENIERDKIQSEEIEAMLEALHELTNKQREIIEMIYFNNISMKDLCRNRRCHYMTIVKLKERALEKLREELEFFKE